MRSNQEAVGQAVLQSRDLGIVKEQKQALMMTGLFFMGLIVIFFMPVLLRSSWLVFVQDDFLYYLKVAQNIAHGNGSTFNGVVATNGYQPLWLIVLVALSWCTSNPRAIMAFLATSNFLAGLATFMLSRRLVQTSGAGTCDSIYIFGVDNTLLRNFVFLWNGGNSYSTSDARRSLFASTALLDYTRLVPRYSAGASTLCDGTFTD